MRNKANFLNVKMNITSISTMAYGKKCLCGDPQNEPNQTQFTLSKRSASKGL